MTLILFRKLLRDVRPALAVVCVLLFLFSALWVKIAQRVTTEIAPFFDTVARAANLNPEAFEAVIFRGPGKVSQAVMGGAEIRFERPADFLAVGLMHPVVITLACVWAVGRSAGAVAGEIDRGTMELLLSQPVPRNRLILAHLLVDAVVLPAICLAVFAGTRAGLALVGPFTVDYDAVRQLKLPFPVPTEPRTMPVDLSGQPAALSNLAALMFAVSGLTLAISSGLRSRWKAVGFGVLAAVLMFVMNVLGQLWDAVAAARPFSVFFYYQPQKILLNGEWTTDLGAAWGGGGFVPVVPVLVAVGAAGYLVALAVFTRRDLPAPL